MKNHILKNIIFFAILFCTVISASAQDKVDTVVMLNGEKREGKVVSVKDDAIKFVYKGEGLEYEFKKSDINVIVFASGRTEVINKGTNSEVASSTVTSTGRKGKIAILPFEFISNNSSLNVNAMAEQLQSDSYLSIKENTNGLELQDLITTNSILAKSNISYANLKSISPKEMAALLGVENVVYGIANVTNKGTSSYGSGVTSYNDKETQNKEGRKATTKSSGSAYNSNNATTMINYETKINLNIFNDKGANLYSESRNSFGTGFDAYHATINYLIKRCPFGSKAKH
ncbi:hypothetical protein OIU80_15010 [Flavobacterium sp. LS1R47]|uniref:Uncharacterized protein n=1 Tax=Flavobacterium frigoritolerans TaxID=2987686 RepID=A0A9X2ZSJ7_9FLAO|nr:hypothetical protein [Flavobacterium frigoritolerans]MCV9933593.1 hypothetical protein [Flavobacterium frigoritolerans]